MNVAKLSDEKLLELLRTREDDLDREAVDEMLRRGDALAPSLLRMAVDPALWKGPAPASAAPVHAAFLLGRLRPPGALHAVLDALELAVEHENVDLLDASYDLLAGFGPDAVPELRAEYPARSPYARLWINDALTWIAFRHPPARPAVREHLLDTALKDPEDEIRGTAAELFLPLATDADDALLDRLLREHDLAEESVDAAREGKGPLPIDPPLDPLDYYSEDARLNRLRFDNDLEDEMDLEEILPSSPSLEIFSKIARDEEGDLRAAPHVGGPEGPGRNEPCPCGSGAKFKKCCGR
jgi:hypothetical protein